MILQSCAFSAIQTNLLQAVSWSKGPGPMTQPVIQKKAGKLKANIFGADSDED